VLTGRTNLTAVSHLQQVTYSHWHKYHLFTTALRSIKPRFTPQMNHIERTSISPSYSKFCYWNMSAQRKLQGNLPVNRLSMVLRLHHTI